MNIVAPYKQTLLDSKVTYSHIDNVERAGYVSNEQKITAFINQGLVLTEFRANSSEFDIPEQESEFESDSQEFLDELTRQAEEFDEKPLLQHLDKITAEETLKDAELSLNFAQKEAEKQSKRSKKQSDTDKIVASIEKGFESVKEKNKTNE